MAKQPYPPTKKVTKSAISPSVAAKKAQTAESKAMRGQVAAKVRYPKMSTASGAAAAAAKGAAMERNAMGGFGKTKATPMISNEGKAANQAARRRAIEGKKKTDAAKKKADTAAYPKPQNKDAFRGMLKKEANKTRGSKAKASSAASAKQKSLAVGRAKSKTSRMK